MATDRDQIVETTIRVGCYADQRRWDELPGLFCEQVRLDYTRLTGDTAIATAQFQATHVLVNPHGAPTWALPLAAKA